MPDGRRSAATEQGLVARLLAGDEQAFAAFAREQHPVLLRVAASRVGRGSPLIEEAAQETWLVFLERLPSFEGRSSLRTFLVGILINVLRNRSRAEARSTPLSALDADRSEAEAEAPALAADRFLPPGDLWAGHWTAAPPPWRIEPGDREAVRQALESALGALPPAQREVVTLRDVLGWEGGEVCSALGISDTHQRVLLHRARTKLRAALEARFGGAG